MTQIYDVIIVGAGAAGLTAAMYTARRNLKTLVLTVDIGGQCNLTSHIENYPGSPSIAGWDLIEKFRKQAVSFGADIQIGKVIATGKKANGFFVKLSNKKQYIAKTLILAHGKVPIKMGIPGEETFLGKGVSTCAVCDGPLFKNKTVAVVGRGSAAIDTAEEMGGLAKKVFLVYGGAKLFGNEKIIQSLKKRKNVDILLNTIPKEVTGKAFVDSLVVDTKNKAKTLKVSGVFVEMGHTVDTSNVKNLVKLSSTKEIIINQRTQTSQPGVFAVGDVTILPYKQVVISAGEGAKAGLEAYYYIRGGKAVMIDWGR